MVTWWAAESYPSLYSQAGSARDVSNVMSRSQSWGHCFSFFILSFPRTHADVRYQTDFLRKHSRMKRTNDVGDVAPISRVHGERLRGRGCAYITYGFSTLFGTRRFGWTRKKKKRRFCDASLCILYICLYCVTRRLAKETSSSSPPGSGWLRNCGSGWRARAILYHGDRSPSGLALEWKRRARRKTSSSKLSGGSGVRACVRVRLYVCIVFVLVCARACVRATGIDLISRNSHI